MSTTGQSYTYIPVQAFLSDPYYQASVVRQ